MAGGRSKFDRAHVKGHGRLGHPNGSAHLGRPLRWRHQEYFRSAESSYGKRGGRDRSKDGTSRGRARQTHADRKMDAFDYYQQGMPGTHQATRQAYEDALFIRACATRAIRLSPFTGFASGHMFAGRCSEHDHDER